MEQPAVHVAHVLGRDRRDEFVAKGFRPGHVFPHSLRFLPKAGPDGLKVAVRMIGPVDSSELWEIVLYADESMLDEFPRPIFFDDDLVWHQQQFGLPGQIATANVVLRGDALWSMVHVSDLVQRIGRRRELKTRIENRFRGWHDMLLNGLMAFAAANGVTRVRLPRAHLAMAHTDRRRTVKPELFERIYDRDPRRIYAVEDTGDWWTVDVPCNEGRLVAPRRLETSIRVGRRICVCHDIERDLGHDPSDGLPDQDWNEALKTMLDVERRLGVKATYNVVGTLLEEVRADIVCDRHCLAFHSFDHRIDRLDQLPACRRVDYRLKGYRPPQSRITDELSEERLLFHNFEWLASSERSLSATSPRITNGLVRVPVAFDDYRLFADRTAFADWEVEAVQSITSRGVAVFGLHDCYSFLWLDRYEGFLERVLQLGELVTVDELAADFVLEAGR